MGREKEQDAQATTVPRVLAVEGMGAAMTGDQLDLFNPDAPFVAGSDTSEAAAEAIEPNAGTLRAEVLAFLRVCGSAGATDEEIQNDLYMNPSTQRPRRVELVNGGFVFKSNRRRPTNSGRQATVWVASKEWIDGAY